MKQNNGQRDIITPLRWALAQMNVNKLFRFADKLQLEYILHRKDGTHCFAKVRAPGGFWFKGAGDTQWVAMADALADFLRCEDRDVHVIEQAGKDLSLANVKGETNKRDRRRLRRTEQRDGCNDRSYLVRTIRQLGGSPTLDILLTRLQENNVPEERAQIALQFLLNRGSLILHGQVVQENK